MTTAANDPDGPDAAAREDPRAAVDDLESAVVHGPDGDTPDPAEDDDPPSPAFDLDLEPEDQGTAEAAAGNPE
ncbi:hypothetical protein [Actinomycetospora sp. TBRC 11914]|uniref:hypothetical protein n=1 Tax=Actinomycetospora sp. TBRC 11914 TaxID=2729387 RepID=UPI00145E9F98|nr:hypothetical protein [Actinomycetospora sp. TBRC 11914]NMO91231.1 hypothetical protein [Actinomycetospora sp. TBRC 11914]